MLVFKQNYLINIRLRLNRTKSLYIHKKINITMKHKTADKFFDNIDYVSIVDTVKGIYTSDGSMNTLLDFERVLDEADLYAFRNWDLGELVQGPKIGRAHV